jgi:hypothetical protein
MNLLNEDINRIKTLMSINEGDESFDNNERILLYKFVDLTVKELNIKNNVRIDYTEDKSKVDTTAVYRYEDGENADIENAEVTVYTKERALQDVMRSVAHELVHHHQNEDGELKGKIQNVGGKIEDEANAKAGELLKMFGLRYPEIYGNVESEFNEQDEGGGETTGGDSSSTNSNTSTWETGLTRGPANQLTINVWNSNISRGKGNMIDQNSKWESGINRGKSNTLT